MAKRTLKQYRMRKAKIEAARFSKASKKWYGKYSTKKDYLFNVKAKLSGSRSRR